MPKQAEEPVSYTHLVYAIIVPGIPLAQFAVVGAVAFLTSSQTAPLMALFMLFEVCHLARCV